MGEWPRGRVKDICELIVDCVNRTAPVVDGPTPYRMIRTTNIRDGRIDLSTCRYVEQDTYDRWTRRAQIKDGDVLLTREAPIGEVGFVQGLGSVFLGQRIMQYRADQSKVVPRFLYYSFRSPDLQHQFGAHEGSGSVVSHIRVADCHDFQINIPPLFEQAAIAELLGDIDDKIELNRRTNETLEAMAQAIFKDWFVDFGPVRRKMQGATDPAAILGGLLPSDSPNAKDIANLFPNSFSDNGLPEGWEKRTLEADFDIVMGQSPPGDTYNECGDGMIFYQGRRDFGWRFPSPRVFCSAPSRIAKRDWSLISVRAPVGDLNRAWDECCIGRGVGAFMHKRGLASLTYYLGHSLQTALLSYDKDGTVFGSINKRQLSNLSTVGMNTVAAEKFEVLVGPVDKLIRSKSAEISTLAETRDYLLPKLMSGKIRAGLAEELVA